MESISSVIVRGILLTKSSLVIDQTGQHEVLYKKKRKKRSLKYFKFAIVMINNGNRTEWSPIW